MAFKIVLTMYKSRFCFLSGFAFACGPGYVHMFEKETPHHWRKRNVYRISRKSYKYVDISHELIYILIYGAPSKFLVLTDPVRSRFNASIISN